MHCTFILFENAAYKVIHFAPNFAVRYAAKSLREKSGLTVQVESLSFTLFNNMIRTCILNSKIKMQTMTYISL